MLTALTLAARRLIKAPGFTAATIATLAICLGANLTIFAVVDAVLFRPLAFAAADRLAAVFNSYPGAGVEHGRTSTANYFDRRGSIKAFVSCSIYQDSSTILGGLENPRRVLTSRVSPDFFATLGVPLAMGTMFNDSNLAYGSSQVSVITDSFWRSYFNADPKVIGRTFLNDGLTITVVGVLPSSFHFLSSHAEFYRPASHDLSERRPDKRHNGGWEMIARLSTGSTFADAQAQINAFNAQQLTDDPIAEVVKGAGYHTVIAGLRQDYVRQVRPMLVLVQCGALLLFLIGGVNIANLVLIRASGQHKEFAIRQALGAQRKHIFLSSLAETMLLSFAGAGLGLVLGQFGIRMLPSLGTDRLPLADFAAFDWRVTSVSLVAASFVAVALTLPTLILSRGSGPATGLHSESRGATSSRATQRLRHFFIVAQVGLAFVLVSSAGLLALSLKRVLEASPGFRTSEILAGNISLPWKDYQDGLSHLAFVERLLPSIRSLPGVEQVSVTTGLPFNGTAEHSAGAIEGITDRPGEKVRAYNFSSVSADYWRTMGIGLVKGRLLEDGDNHSLPHVCVVDQPFAERYWPGGDPLGHRITPDNVKFDKDNCLTIVGVVSEVKQNDLTEANGYGSIYMPYCVTNSSFFSIVVRSNVPASVIAPMLQKAVRQLDPGLPIDDLKSMQARIDDSLVARRSPAILAGIFSAVALLLAAVGTYGVLSYAVGQRRREIGVRMALGALPNQVRIQFLGIGLRLFGFGITTGLLGAWLTGRGMQSVLYGVPGVSGAILGATAVIMGAITLAACMLPACSAARVNPMEALRIE